MRVKVTSKSNQIRNAYCNLKNASYNEKTGMYQLSDGTFVNEYDRTERLEKLKALYEREFQRHCRG